jgi:hypothetical protein
MAAAGPTFDADPAGNSVEILAPASGAAAVT